MAKQNVGQLVYTVEVDDRQLTRALQATENRAASAGNRVTSHFTRIEKETIKAQRALFSMASAADVLDAKLGGFVFSAVRAVDVLTAIGASARTTSSEVTKVARSLNAVQAAERAISGNILGQLNQPIPRVRQGAGGRFESIPGSAAAAAARSGSTISTEALAALAVGPTIERSALAATKASTAMAALGRAATVAGAGVAFLASGFKALFLTPVGVAIAAIAAGLYIYSKASEAAAAADEKRKKAIEAATEAHKKQLAVLEEIKKNSQATAKGEPITSALALRVSRAEGLGPVAQINAASAVTVNTLTNQATELRGQLAGQERGLNTARFVQAANREGRTLGEHEEFQRAVEAEKEARAAILRTNQAIANIEAQIGQEELNRIRKVNEEQQKTADIVSRGIASLQEGITSLPGRLAEGVKREQARLRSDRNERVAGGTGSTADIIAFARERALDQKAQDDVKKQVKALVDSGAFGRLGKVVSDVFGLDPDKPAEVPSLSRRFSSTGILGSSFGGFTRADVLGSGRTPEDEQVSLLTQIANVLTKIERKPLVGLNP